LAPSKAKNKGPRAPADIRDELATTIAAARKKAAVELQRAEAARVKASWKAGKRWREEYYKAIGRNIRRVREARGVSQAELGVALMPSQTRASLSNLERGRQAVLLHTAVQISNRLGVTLDNLIRGKA
jgi:DNA-binding XRE family transcriptional regulator